MTQESLASSIDVSAAYIHQLETGKISPPTEKRCRQLSWVLGIPFNEIWERSRVERLAYWVNREGLSGAEALQTLSVSGGSISSDGPTPVNVYEEALIKLVRTFDPQTSKDFNGLIVMLLRHNTKEEVQRFLEEFLRCA